MNIKAEKERMLRDLLDLGADAEILSSRVDQALEALQQVNTEAEVIAFVERFSGLADDLEHIELF